MTPRAQMSERASAALALRTCSGDMYPGEPMTSPLAVSISWAPAVLNSVIFEMPKSRTFTSGEPSRRRVTKRFEGFRSRCTMPVACASASASQACRTKSTTCRTGIGPRFLSQAARSSPSRYSITM